MNAHAIVPARLLRAGTNRRQPGNFTGWRTKQDLKELELRMTLRLGSMMVVAIGVVAVLVKPL